MSDEYVPPLGGRYSQLYLERNNAENDSIRARHRVSAIYYSEIDNLDLLFYRSIERRQGVKLKRIGLGYNFEDFFLTYELRDFLDSITTIYATLRQDRRNSIASNWINEVNSVFIEENLSVRVRQDGVVEPFVDTAFNLNRTSLINGLNNPSLLSVRTEVQNAYDDLTLPTPDTKDAVKSIFEAIEIYIKLRLSNSNISRLTANVVNNNVKPIIKDKLEEDSVAQDAANLLLSSLTDWVNAAHTYRHGQRTEAPSPPPMDIAILFVDQGASFLRWLLGYFEDE